MDTNSIYDGYGLREKNTKVINKSFYTEKIKESDEHEKIIKKLKNILMKKLLWM